jgi:hypothetical protein
MELKPAKSAYEQLINMKIDPTISTSIPHETIISKRCRCGVMPLAEPMSDFRDLTRSIKYTCPRCHKVWRESN